MSFKQNLYGSFNTRDLLKIFAIFLMAVDHIGYYIFPNQDLWRAIGRASVPIWFFLLGAYPTKGLDKKLVIAAFIVFTFDLYHGKSETLNILFSIIICRKLISMKLLNTIHEQHFLMPIFLCLVFFPFSQIFISYGSLGFLLTYCGLISRTGISENKKLIFYSLSGIFYALSQQLIFNFSEPLFILSFCLIMLVMLTLYKFKQKEIEISKSLEPIALALSRYSLYFYVIHIAILILISELL